MTLDATAARGWHFQRTILSLQLETEGSDIIAGRRCGTQDRRGLTCTSRPLLFARCDGELLAGGALDAHNCENFWPRSMLTTARTTGICYKTWPQAPFDCTRSDSGTWQAGRRFNLSSISACATRCLQCERCAWVAYGRRECAWYASCEHPVDKPAYERMRVRAAPPPGPRLEAGHTCGRVRTPKAVTPAPLPVPAPECRSASDAASFLALAGRKHRLACLGDSITRGDGAHEAGRGSHAPFKRCSVGRGNYPAALQALLGSEDWLVGNFGVSGRTAMPTGDAYAATREFQSLRCFAPELAVLMLGTNDAKPVHWGPRQRFPHARLVRALVDLGRQAGQ